MATEMNILQGPLTLAEDLTLMGVLKGDCTVPVGRSLDLLGVVTGNLVVEEGGVAVVMGVVTGSVLARGQVRVMGVITGSASGSGLTADPGSYIQGVRQ